MMASDNDDDDEEAPAPAFRTTRPRPHPQPLHHQNTPPRPPPPRRGRDRGGDGDGDGDGDCPAGGTASASAAATTPPPPPPATPPPPRAAGAKGRAATTSKKRERANAQREQQRQKREREEEERRRHFEEERRQRRGVVTPAYAYKNAETGLLEMRALRPPTPSRVANSVTAPYVQPAFGGFGGGYGMGDGDGDGGGNVNAANKCIYPIALNGGGVGLYGDPREYGTGGNTVGPSGYKKLAPKAAAAAGGGENSSAGMMAPGVPATDAYDDAELGVGSTWNARPADAAASSASLPPWRQWEGMHNELSRSAARNDHRQRSVTAPLALSNLGCLTARRTRRAHAAMTANHPSRWGAMGGRAGASGGGYNEDDFEFALVLVPNRDYAHCADWLDFRAEDTGFSSYAEMTANNGGGGVNSLLNHHHDPHSAAAAGHRPLPPPTVPGGTPGEVDGRKVQTPSSNRKSLFDRAMGALTPPRGGGATNALKRRLSFKRPPGGRAAAAGGGGDDANANASSSSPLVTPPGGGGGGPTPPYSTPPRRKWGNGMYPQQRQSSASEIRRLDVTSPPVRTLRGMTPPRAGRGGGRKKAAGGGVVGRVDVNNDKKKKRTLRMEDFPSQVVPRGIAARSNGLTEFLAALGRTGIVVRRHKPGAAAEFVKLSSKDGGDTITFQYLQPEEAHVALMEQGVRYNKSRKWGEKRERSDGISGNNATASASDPFHGSGNNSNCLSLPDHLAAKQYREDLKQHGGIRKAAVDLVTQVSYSGSVRAADILAVHPAIHDDPFEAAAAEEDEDDGAAADEDEDKELCGTISLRASRSDFVSTKTFSLVLPPNNPLSGIVPGLANSSEENLGEKWYDGRGSSKNFRYFDFEAATQGEYWLVFRGFLLLHRDAVTGRFAAQRASGFSSHYNKRELEAMYKREREEDMKNNDANPASVKKVMERMHPNSILRQRRKNGDENDENAHPNTIGEKKHGEEENVKKELFPVSRTPSRKRFDKNDTTHPPPPSDFFLGFNSAGTMIWGRLRQAGLETQRIYDLDTKRVMIKLRCPTDRLQDVAEVLRLKLRTHDGTYAPFRESTIAQFLPSGDYPSHHSHSATDLFRSSDRQTVIDFIVRSRIRDSGAELGERTSLGKQIEMRIPLHMHVCLEALYSTWVLFWQDCNWKDRDGKSMCVGRENQAPDILGMQSTGASSSSADPTIDYGNASLNDKANVDAAKNATNAQSGRIPSFFYRLLVGSFYQPLDSIHQYFGESVAFYFAWLQHCSYHLVFLSMLGVIVFICQVSTGNWDHPIRPFFSVAVMLWSFVVMVTWRQRQNALAHRWGTLNYEEEETTRPQFHGDYRRCEITNEWIVYYPSWKRWLKYTISFPLTIAVTGATLIGILMVYANRELILARYFESIGKQYSEQDLSPNLSIRAIVTEIPKSDVKLTAAVVKDPTFWLIVAGFPSLIGLTLPLMNFLFMNISQLLCNWENYRTESEYRNHLIVKVFSFRFVCYFASLYYYAFLTTGLKPGSQSANEIENSILRVSATLLIYLTVAHWWNLLVTIYFPLLFHRWRLYRHRLHLRDEIRKLESLEDKQLERNETRTSTDEEWKTKLANKRVLLQHAQNSVWEETMLPLNNSFHEYVYMVIQFGYVTCFSVVFPLTPLICLLNHLFGMRLDAYKLCRARRRPLVQKAGGIGVWEHVLHIVTVVGVLTNCALMAFTNSLFRNLAVKIGPMGLFMVVVAWEHIMLLIKYVMQSATNPMPKSVIDNLKKERYQMARKRNFNMRAKKVRRSIKNTRGVAAATGRDGPNRNATRFGVRSTSQRTKRKGGNNHGRSLSSTSVQSQDVIGLSTIPSLSRTETDWTVKDSPRRNNSNRSHLRHSVTTKRSPLRTVREVYDKDIVRQAPRSLSPKRSPLNGHVFSCAKSPPSTLRRRVKVEVSDSDEQLPPRHMPVRTPKRRKGETAETSHNGAKGKGSLAPFQHELEQGQSPAEVESPERCESPFASFFTARALKLTPPKQSLPQVQGMNNSISNIFGDTPSCAESFESAEKSTPGTGRVDAATTELEQDSTKMNADTAAMERIRNRLLGGSVRNDDSTLRVEEGDKEANSRRLQQRKKFLKRL